MQAVILAGGKGTRLKPYTTILPKPLMPIGDICILEVIIRQLKRYGFHRIILTVGYLAELLEAYFGDGRRFGVDIIYSREDKPLGTAGPLALIADKLDPVFLVMNGDILTTLNYNDLLAYHYKRGGIATIAMHAKDIKIDLGVIEINNNDEVIGYIEKPTMHYMVSMGIYVFDRRVTKYIEFGKRLDFPDLILRLLAHGEKVIAYHSHDYWLDIGRPDDYERAIEEFEQRRKELLGE